jgi:hypothetical protein
MDEPLDTRAHAAVGVLQMGDYLLRSGRPDLRSSQFVNHLQSIAGLGR